MEQKSGEVYYIAADKCYEQRVGHEDAQGQKAAFITLFLKSIGLAKFAGSGFPIGYLCIVVFTEIQLWIFNHPYFQVYVIQRIEKERKNYKMRAFLYVQQFHLNREWSYQSNNEKISVLGNRLENLRK